VLRSLFTLRARGVAADSVTLAGAMLEAERDTLTTVEAEGQLRIWKHQAELARRQSGGGRIRGRR